MKIISLGSGTVGISRVKISSGSRQTSFVSREEHGTEILAKLKTPPESYHLISWEDDIGIFGWSTGNEDFSWKNE